MSKIHKKILAVTLLLAAGGSQLFAQAGNDNPTGSAGEFEGSGIVTTGCHYNSYTGSAQRSVTDLVVAGGIGAYPLAFTRTSNSRYNIGGDDAGNGLLEDFGSAGSWLHSYQWAIDYQEKMSGAGRPTVFTVRYPDGRIVTFSTSTNGDPYYRGGKGVRDRLQVFWDSSTAGRAYLIMPDGGKVWFSIAITKPQGCSGCTDYTYTVRGIIDPYGQTTTITGSPQSLLVTVTEPGGRWIKMFYTNPAYWTYVIDHITASDGRSVQYSYTGPWYAESLMQVTYFNDPTLVATYTYQADNTDGGGNSLLRTCIDPMYDGPMWKIAYNYATGTNPDGTAVVYGQILSENYFDGTNIGAAVSTLTITSTTTRRETRADGKTRTFTYNPTPLLISWTDFKGHTASQTYDTNGYVNAVTDFNGHTTNFTKNAFTGGILTKTFPSTPGDTPPNTPRGVVTVTYGSTTCPDPNNRDANNPYYPYSFRDEGGHTTTYLRDSAKRVTQISYPDGGSESFTYNSFGQVLTHVMRTGGTEAFTYDSRGLLQTYRDAYHATGNPTASYQYDLLDRVSGVTDALGSAAGDINHTTSYGYNARGQLLSTTLPTDPIDGQRHTVTNVYNADGTLQSTTDQLGHVTSFTYDDYRRPLNKTTPQRFTGDTTPRTGYVYYDANGTGNDYTHTDANVTHVTSPGGEKITTTYDENFRKTSVIVADGTSDAAKTSYGYDNIGNLTSVISPKEQPGQPYAGQSTVVAYDERNRPMSATDPLGNVTSCTYDAAGRKANATRPNGQTITYDSFDAANRLLQQTVKQTPDPDAVTKYTYYTSGLLHTMQDPRLVANNSSYNYSYSYDQMGRKTSGTYPPDSSNVQRSESWHYDTAGRVDTFTNRASNVQTTTYDALNRPTSVSWNDNGLTPTVTFAYDIASRTTSVTNVNANITHTYLNDNLLNTETTTYADSTARTVTYTYNADGNRATIQYPNGAYSFAYNYTARNQLKTLVNNSGGGTVITYAYDPDGNLTTRTPDNSTSSAYTYDALDRVTHIGHALNGDTRTFDYAYDSVSNRKWTKRDSGTGDVFSYDLNDQATAILLNITNPDTTAVGSQTINYDANGNRTTFSAYGPTDTYTTNNLNQYTSRNSSNATYDNNGDMTIGLDGSTYTYDSQNRLLTATKNGSSETFTYDGLNRQVSRKIGTATPLYNVYDGWDLIGEYQPTSTTPLNAYLFGAGGLVKLLTASSSFYYYQDGSGSTSHLADSTGHLVEWYRYDLQGTPMFYNAANIQIPSSSYGIRHLFTGQQWYSDIGLYDLRNRFYSPDIGRFLQGDPIGFSGDASNLYRYVGNNPITQSDPNGTMPLSPWFGRGVFTSNTWFGPAGVAFAIGAGFTFAAMLMVVVHESAVVNPAYYNPTRPAVYGGPPVPDDAGSETEAPRAIPPSEQDVEVVPLGLVDLAVSDSADTELGPGDYFVNAPPSAFQGSPASLFQAIAQYGGPGASLGLGSVMLPDGSLVTRGMAMDASGGSGQGTVDPGYSPIGRPPDLSIKNEIDYGAINRAAMSPGSGFGVTWNTLSNTPIQAQRTGKQPIPGFKFHPYSGKLTPIRPQSQNGKG